MFSSPESTPYNVPDITVIVPVHNGVLTIERCVTSIAQQSLGEHRIEIIVVDDASDDGTAKELERLARQFSSLRMLTIPRMGRPAGPRNIGLRHARGRYVFFADADDWLGPEALERMLHMAESNGTDIVLGKLVGVGGRKPATSMFRENMAVTDVFSSNVYRNLVVFKLFRRGFLDQLGLSFNEEVEYGEDIVFTSLALLNTSKISIVADYDCYYWSLVPGENLSRKFNSRSRVQSPILAMINLVRSVPEGPARDTLLVRHLSDVVGFLKRWGAEGTEARDEDFDTMRQAVAHFASVGALHILDPEQRLAIQLLLMNRRDLVREVFTQGLPTSDDVTKMQYGDRIYAVLPYFRDPSVAVPEWTYDVTDRLSATATTVSVMRSGESAMLTGWFSAPGIAVDNAAMRLVLTSRHDERRIEYSVTPLTSPRADIIGWRGEFGLLTADAGVPLSRGIWDLHVEASLSSDVAVSSRLSAGHLTQGKGLPPRWEHVVPGGSYFDGEMYVTRRNRSLSLDVGHSRSPGSHAYVADAAWSKGALQLTCGGWLAKDSSMPTQVELVLRHRAEHEELVLPGESIAFPDVLDMPAARRGQSPAGGSPRPIEETLPAPAVPPHAIGHVATIALPHQLRPGVWDAYLRFRRGQETTDVRVSAATFLEQEDVHPSRRSARKSLLFPYLTKAHNLSIRSGDFGHLDRSWPARLFGRIRRG
ncbi:glycosyltransferase family A protein [Streptomyces sp. N35]|uniref:glycosyltransferase family 2 protein n=1 Tax=Streptomyces sp. N35 TaxID=2795730 RepID=UPI0018F6D215|nr:glycosyltransferase family A protein [Streptomyces sp. N35]